MRVLRIDAQRGARLAVLAQGAQGAHDQPAGQPAPPPGPPHRDRVENASPESEAGVVLRMDRHEHVAGDLITVPGHLPQLGDQVRLAEEALVCLLSLVDLAPVVAEGLHVGLPDRAPVLGEHGPHLEPLGHRQRGDGLEVRSHHVEEVAGGLVALADHDPLELEVAVPQPHAEPIGRARRSPAGLLAQAALPVAQQRPLDAPTAKSRVEDDSRLIGHAAVVADLTFDPGVAGDLPVELDDEAVLEGDRAAEVRVEVVHPLAGDELPDPDRQAPGVVGRDHPVVVHRPAVAANPQPTDRGEAQGLDGVAVGSDHGFSPPRRRLARACESRRHRRPAS